MRTQIYARISSRVILNQVSGFTLIELLTVVVIGGILAAISAPYFLSRAVAAKQAEGKMLVGTMNRAQQAYFTQNGKFSDTLDALALSLGSKNYDLQVQSDSITSSHAANYVTSKQGTVKSYVGLAAIVQIAAGEVAMQTILCEAETPGAVQAATPTFTPDSINCAAGTRPLN